MVKTKSLFYLLILVSVISLTGCGGGSAFTPPTPPLPQVPGNLRGYVQDMDGNPLEGVAVKLSNGNTFVSLDDGSYRFDSISAKTYNLLAKKDNFQDVICENISIKAGETLYLPVIRMVPGDAGDSQGFYGRVVDAINGAGISGINIRLRVGMDVQSGTVVADTVTGIEGNFFFDNLPSGTYTVEINGNDVQYVTDYFTLVCLEGKLTYQKYAIPPIPSEGSLRIILTWGSDPDDLDAHLTGPKHPQDSSERFHIYWTTGYGTYQFNNFVYARVDHDVTDKYGPETVTIHELLPNDVYRFSVHNICYDTSNDSMELARSGAVVKVYRLKNGEVLISTHHVPQEPGNLWTVFELTAGTDILIKPINLMTFERDANRIQ